MTAAFLLHNLAYHLKEAGLWARDLHSYSPHTHRTRLRGPTTVQIQTINRCNAACIMCPYASPDPTAAAKPMDDSLYLRILRDIRQVNSVRHMLLMLQNEPLLDPKFIDRIRIVKELFGRSVVTGTVTNGAPLTPSVIDRLSASGIDYVSVSIDAIHGDTFARIRHGLDYQRVVDNTLSLAKRLGSGRISVRFLRQRDNDGEEEAFAQYWKSHGIRVVFMDPTNRAGFLQSYERIRKERPYPWKKFIYPILNRCVPACPFPFSRLSILADGRVILCCHDWGPRDTVGDLARQTLAEVWNGERINHYRQLLWMHQIKESLVCADCSFSGHYWNI